MSSRYLAPPERPRLVWLIGILYLLVNLLVLGTALSHGRQALAGLTPFARLMVLLSPALEIVGAIALMALRRIAPYVLTLDLVLIGANWLTPETTARPAVSSDTLANAVGTCISVAVCLYSWRLLRRRQLR